MSDGQPFGTQQSSRFGKKSAIGLAGSGLVSIGNKIGEKLKEDRNLQKQWEFAASLHAHNEGISHHYQMERMQADHALQVKRMGVEHRNTMKQMGAQATYDKDKITHTGEVGRQNLEHAAGVAQSMPKHNVSMSTGAGGEVSFSAQKVQKPKKDKSAEGAEEAPAAEAPSASPAKPPTTRTSARDMSGAKSKASRTPGVTSPRKARNMKSGDGYSI